MKLYKYCSLNTGVEIVRKQRVLLNTPVDFNDPFDSDFVITDEQKENCKKLVYNFCLFKGLYKFLSSLPQNIKKTSKPLILTTKREIDICLKLMEKTMLYESFPFLDRFVSLYTKQNPQSKAKINKSLERIDKESVQETERILKLIRISCFSKKKDSVLMWSHYADKHKGVCIEFEEERDIFSHVIYSKDRPEFNIEKIYSHVLACELFNKKNYSEDKLYFDLLIKPFLTKSKEWEYENEIRAVLTEDFDGVDMDDLQPYLNMKITKIYLGLRTDGEKLKELIELAKTRRIPLVFMKKDEKKYLVVEDKERKLPLTFANENKDNAVDFLYVQMNECLNNNLCIPALFIGLTIPGLLAKAIYPNLNYRDGYLKIMADTFDVYNKSPDDKFGDLFIGGEVCYALKEALQNYGTTKVNDKIEHLKVVLKSEKKKNFEVYVDGILMGSESRGDLRNEIELNIREFCMHLELYFKDYRSKHKDELDKLPIIDLQDVDKQRNSLYECTVINDMLLGYYENK